MNIYRPSEPSIRQPRPWLGEERESPIDRVSWNDSEVRRAMEHALLASEEVVQEITKCLAERESVPLLVSSVDYPFIAPPPAYYPGCMSDQQERDNKVLRDFAFDSQDALASHFGGDIWNGWFIAPFFAEGDDTHGILHIGVFLDEESAHEVIE